MELDDPFIGLLGVLGVGLVLLGWYATRGASEWTRTAVRALGVTMLFTAVGSVFFGVAPVVMDAVAFPREGGGDAGRVLLAGIGVALGAYAVVTLHRRAEDAVEDLAADAAVVASVPGDDGDEDEFEDRYTRVRRALVATAPWTDAVALGLAVGLPLAALSPYSGPHELGPFTLVHYVLVGVLPAAALLALPRGDDRPVLAAFALVAAGALAVPFVPESRVALWAVFARGLAAGLIAAAAFGVLRGLPGDRGAAVAGALVALVLVVAGAAVHARVLAGDQGTPFDDFPSGPNDVVPTDLFPPPG